MTTQLLRRARRRLCPKISGRHSREWDVALTNRSRWLWLYLIAFAFLGGCYSMPVGRHPSERAELRPVTAENLESIAGIYANEPVEGYNYMWDELVEWKSKISESFDESFIELSFVEDRLRVVLLAEGECIEVAEFRYQLKRGYLVLASRVSADMAVPGVWVIGGTYIALSFHETGDLVVDREGGGWAVAGIVPLGSAEGRVFHRFERTTDKTGANNHQR